MDLIGDRFHPLATIEPGDQAWVDTHLLPDLTAADPPQTELVEYLASRPDWAGFLGAVGTGARYLGDLMRRRPALLAALIVDSPETVLQRITDGLADLDHEDEATVMARLRHAKMDVALLTALADIGQVWDGPKVTAVLTDLADLALSICANHILRRQADAGKLTLNNPDDPAFDSGWIILAMGKHGAGELNYSSDIDLVVFFDPGVMQMADPLDIQPLVVKMTRQLAKMMQERTRDGYIFRTDLRLRPDPGATQVAISADAALNYYESFGQNWERAAFIKARPAAGDLLAGYDFLEQLKPFIWRKYLDYAAIMDVHSIKRQIHSHRGFSQVAVAGHNVKLGRGGIREVEFFAQTQQLIAGGRNPLLRHKRTDGALERLAVDGWISQEAAEQLSESYWYMRKVEHRIQMLQDEQTHLLPSDEAALNAVARLMGAADRAAFTTEITATMRRIEHHYAALFEAAPALAPEQGSLVFTGDDDDPETLETLTELGFSEPKRVTAAVRAWHAGRLPAVRTARAREALTELTPTLLHAIARTDNADAAFTAFDQFLSKLPMGVQLFATLRSNPHLMSLIALIMGAAPKLAHTIVQRPHALAALLEPDHSQAEIDDSFHRRFNQMLGEANHYEDGLNQARIIGQEQIFLIGAEVIKSTFDAARAGKAYADLADAVVGRMLEWAMAELIQRHGRISGGTVAVVALGKLGSQEMTAASDLDLILLYDFDPDCAESDGPKPLSPNLYYMRLTQRLVAALSSLTSEGNLYEVDFRLRPSGNAGPLATQLSAFRRYHAEQAWTWEHLALTRARVIAGDSKLCEAANIAIAEILSRPREPAAIAEEVLKMRARIATEKPPQNTWDLKLIPGGLTDIEFLAQYLQLIHGHQHPGLLHANTTIALRRQGEQKLISPTTLNLLEQSLGLYHRQTQIMRLALTEAFDPATAPGGLKKLMVEASGLPDFRTLEAHLNDTAVAVYDLCQRLLREAADP